MSSYKDRLFAKMVAEKKAAEAYKNSPEAQAAKRARDEAEALFQQQLVTEIRAMLHHAGIRS